MSPSLDDEYVETGISELIGGTSKNVGEAVSARQKQAKNGRSRARLYELCEHFELVFNAAMTTQVVFRGAPGREGDGGYCRH